MKKENNIIMIKALLYGLVGGMVFSIVTRFVGFSKDTALITSMIGYLNIYILVYFDEKSKTIM